MNQTGLTFLLSEDGLQASPLCLNQATGLYYVAGEAPMAQGEFGSVDRRFYPAAGGFKPCVLRVVLLPAGGTLSLEEEYTRLCAISTTPGVVKWLNSTELTTKGCILVLTGGMTCRFIAGESLAVFLSRNSRGACTGSRPMDMQCRMHALQQLSVVRTVVLEGGARVVDVLL